MITYIKDEKDLKIHDRGITIHTFTTPECVPCKIINPIMDRIASKSDNVHIYRINSHNHPALVASHDVQSVPTAYFYANGTLIKRLVGVLGVQHELESM